MGQAQAQLSLSQQPQSVNSYIQLLQQREEENRAEVERLTAEIRSLKLQLLQVAGRTSSFIYFFNINPSLFHQRENF